MGASRAATARGWGGDAWAGLLPFWPKWPRTTAVGASAMAAAAGWRTHSDGGLRDLLDADVFVVSERRLSNGGYEAHLEKWAATQHRLFERFATSGDEANRGVLQDHRHPSVGGFLSFRPPNPGLRGHMLLRRGAADAAARPGEEAKINSDDGATSRADAGGASSAPFEYASLAVFTDRSAWDDFVDWETNDRQQNWQRPTLPPAESVVGTVQRNFFEGVLVLDAAVSPAAPATPWGAISGDGCTGEHAFRTRRQLGTVSLVSDAWPLSTGGSTAVSTGGSVSTEGSQLEQAWWDEWSDRLGCFLISTPPAVHACLGALSLVLARRFEAFARQQALAHNLAPNLGHRGTSPNVEEGCEWLQKENSALELPEFPAFDPRLQFTLPPIPRLLPPIEDVHAYLHSYLRQQQPSHMYPPQADARWRPFAVGIAAAPVGGLLALGALRVFSQCKLTRSGKK